MAAISMDLRTRIFEARQSGDSTAEVADRFAVSPAFVRRLMQRHRRTGSLAPSTARRGPQPRSAESADRLRELNARHPDLTPAEVRDRLGVPVSALTVWRMLRRLGLTFKKSRPARPSRTASTSGRPATPGRGS
jgi:transposase